MKKKTVAKFYIILFVFTAFCVLAFVKSPNLIVIKDDNPMDSQLLSTLFPVSCVCIITASLLYFVDLVLVKWGFYFSMLLHKDARQDKIRRLEDDFKELNNKFDDVDSALKYEQKRRLKNE